MRTAIIAATWGMTGPSCATTPHPPDDLRSRAPCVVGDPEGEVIVIPGSLTAPETGIVLQQARPDDPANLQNVGQAVVAFGGRSEVQGVTTDYPPGPQRRPRDSLARWDERRSLPGLRLTSADGQQAVLVALRLTDPSRLGHLHGVTLDSTEGGEARSVTFEQPLLVEPPGRLCTVEDVDATREWVGP